MHANPGHAYRQSRARRRAVGALLLLAGALAALVLCACARTRPCRPCAQYQPAPVRVFVPTVKPPECPECVGGHCGVPEAAPSFDLPISPARPSTPPPATPQPSSCSVSPLAGPALFLATWAASITRGGWLLIGAGVLCVAVAWVLLARDR